MNDELAALVLDILADWPEADMLEGNPAMVTAEQMAELVKLAGFKDMAEAQATLDAFIESHNRKLAGEKSD